MLFENNNNSYLDMLFNVGGINFNIQDDKTVVTNENEGFLKGNMFANEYVPYKNFTYLKPKVKGEKEELLYKIMEASFMVNDYNLYLDVHPSDMHILNKYKDAVDRLNQLVKIYDEKYGPLSINSANYDTFKWVESPWPWEREDGKYV